MRMYTRGTPYHIEPERHVEVINVSIIEMIRLSTYLFINCEQLQKQG